MLVITHMPAYNPIHTARLYEQIVEQIESQVISGELHYGDRLPTERELADTFGVSRTAVREAVMALVEKGLVQSHPGRGTFITDGASRAMRDSLGLIMRLGAADNSNNLMEAREIIEPEIAALAAERAGDEDMATLRSGSRRWTMRWTTPTRSSRPTLVFISRSRARRKNALIATLLDPIVGLLREHRKQIFMNRGAPQGQYHHKRILNAVAKHEPEAARRAMRAHLRQVRTDGKAAAAIAP